jgi:hypothetical protein
MLISIIVLTSSLVGAETVTWSNTGGGLWNMPANWTPAKVPAPGDDVVINSTVSGTITVDSEANIKTLTLSGGHTIALSSHKLTISNGAKEVFYSVGQNTADHKTGTPTITITISSGIATFSTAQTAANMGVGDRVIYGGSSVAYIRSKISTTQWTLVTATGGTPIDVASQTVNSISHEYTSLSDAIAGASDANHLNTTDLVAGNYILNIPCYFDSGPDIAPVTITGYTTGSSNYIKIYTPNNISTEVNQSQRHQGMWTTNSYRLEISGTAARAITIYQNYSSIEGLQIGLFGADGGFDAWGIATAGTEITEVRGVKISHCIIKDEQTGTADSHIGINMIFWEGQTGTGYVWNNIVYGFKIGLGMGMHVPASSDAKLYVYNNTVYDCKLAFDTYFNQTGTILKNNIAQSCTDGFPSQNNVLSDYNISDLASDAPGAHSKNSATVIFVNAAGKNFHLSPSDTAAKDAGVDLSGDANLPFNTDIDGQTRTIPWDIGADQYVP